MESKSNRSENNAEEQNQPVSVTTQDAADYLGIQEQTDTINAQEEPRRGHVLVKDSRRSWLVVLGGFVIQITLMGILHVWGVFFVALLEDFKISKATGAWVGSVAYGLTMTFGPVAGSLIKRYGNRKMAISGSLMCSFGMLISSFVPTIGWMFFTFSILFGIGNSLAFSTTMNLPSVYFDKYVTLATGMIVSGSSFGTLLLAPISQGLISSIGWRNTFRVFSVMCLGGLWSGYIYQDTRQAETAVQRIRRSMMRRVMAELYLWKNKVFVIWIAALFFVMFGYYVPYVHLVSYAEDLGISPETGSSLLTIFGASTAVGRLSFGKIIEYGYINRLHMHQLSMVVSGTGSMILPLIRSYAGLVSYVVLVGLVDGCFVVLLPVITTALVGADNLVIAWGFVIGVTSVTYTLGPPVAGWLYDATGSYNVPFHITGVPVVIGAVILFFIPWAQRTAQSTNILTAAIDNYMVMSEERSGEGNSVPSDRELFAISSDNVISLDETSDIVPKGSFIRIEAPGPNDLTQRMSSAQHQNEAAANSSSAVPLPVAQAIEVFKKQSENLVDLEQRNAKPRRRLYSECKAAEYERYRHDPRAVHSLSTSPTNPTPFSLQDRPNNLPQAIRSAISPDRNILDALINTNEGPLPHAASTVGNAVPSVPLPIPQGGTRTPTPSSITFVQFTSPIGSPPGVSGPSSGFQMVPSATASIQSPILSPQSVIAHNLVSPVGSPPPIALTSHDSALPCIAEEPTQSGAGVAIATNGASWLPNTQGSNALSQNVDQAITGLSQDGAGLGNDTAVVISGTSLRLLWEELEQTPDQPPESLVSPRSVDTTGVFKMSDVSLDTNME